MSETQARATAAGDAPPLDDDLDADVVAPSALQRLAGSSTTWIVLILLGLVAAFAILAFSQFVSASNFRNIAVYVALLLPVVVGQTFVIVTAGIDLSVGSVLVFAGVVAAKLMLAVGGDSAGVILLGAACALAAGLGWGIVNGVLITKARVPPLIVTLGTLGMALGGAYLITGGVDVREVPFTLVTSLGTGEVAGVPWVVIVAAVVALAGGVLLHATRFGRYTYAVGSNPEATRRAGIAVDRHLIEVYALSGLLAGASSFLYLAFFATTTIGGHATDNLNSIAAVVIGGTSLFGGVGTIAGSVVGLFIPAVLQNGFVIVGVQAFWQQIAVGAVLILAVYLDQLRRRANQRT
jgi:ribose transport system permease protein